MFKDFPKVTKQEDYIGYTLQLMDKFGIEKAMIGVSLENAVAQQALKDHPDRFFGAAGVDPNQGMEGVRELVECYERFGIKAATAFPCGYFPQVADPRQEVLPALREVRGARHPDLRAASACRARASRWTPRRSSTSTRCAGSSPS